MIDEAKVKNLIELFGDDYDLEHSGVLESCNKSFEAGAKWQAMSWKKQMKPFFKYIILVAIMVVGWASLVISVAIPTIWVKVICYIISVCILLNPAIDYWEEKIDKHLK